MSTGYSDEELKIAYNRKKFRKLKKIKGEKSFSQKLFRNTKHYDAGYNAGQKYYEDGFDFDPCFEIPDEHKINSTEYTKGFCKGYMDSDEGNIQLKP